MDTTTAPAPAPGASVAPAWWRRPLADVLDVALVAVSGLLVGGAVAAALLADVGDDPWAGLGAALLGLGAGLLAGVGTWVAVLVLVGRRRTSPGARLVGVPATRVVPTVGRHAAVVVVVWAGLGTVAAAVEPWPAGPLGGGLAAAVVAGASLGAWGRGELLSRLRVVGVAALTGLLVTGAVPDRAPYPWELRRQAEAAVRATLEDDPAARRACDVAAVGRGTRLLASHATEPCHDPDREWLVDRHPAVVAEHLAGVVADVVRPHAAVGLVDVRGGREVRVDGLAVATVLRRRDGCATTVVVGDWAPAVSLSEAGDGRCR